LAGNAHVLGSVMVMPMPTAGPFDGAIEGFSASEKSHRQSRCLTAANARRPVAEHSGAVLAEDRTGRTARDVAPAQKRGPNPVTMISANAVVDVGGAKRSLDLRTIAPYRL